MKSTAEEPDYTVVKTNGVLEIRDYSPIILAEVEVSGERKQAMTEGFKILADYIFGNNTSQTKMKMTVPVTNEISEQLALVTLEQEQPKDKWRVRFMMPKKYSIETLPKPTSQAVTLITSPAKRVAVIQFSGLADDETIKQQTEQLKAFISAEKLQPCGGPILAFYSPPWTLPLLRRNEVMIKIRNDYFGDKSLSSGIN